MKKSLSDIVQDVLSGRVLQYPTDPLYNQGKSTLHYKDVMSIALAIQEAWKAQGGSVTVEGADNEM